MKKFLLLILIAISMVGCGLFKKSHKTEKTDEPYDVIYSRTIDNLTLAQFDSICVADTLLGQLNDWYSSSFIDYNTQKTVFKHIYIKQNSKLRTFYILTLYEETGKMKMTIRTEEDND